jgi:hypothetical protein
MDNRRQHARFPFSGPLEYQKNESSPSQGSVAGDISQGGFKLKVNEFLPLGTILEVKIQLPGRLQVIPAHAKVVWVKEIPFRDDGWEVGLELIAKEASSAIREFIGLHRFDQN